MLSRFYLIAIASHETLHLALSEVGKHSAVASMRTATKFSYSSFGARLSDVS